MKHSSIAITAALIALCESSPAQERNRFQLQARVGFNLKAEFSDTQPTLSASAPGPQFATGVDRLYDDGYVRVDSSGNAGNVTWFWGYENSSQATAGAIAFQSRSLTDLASPGADTGTFAGPELVYQRDLGVGERMRWGVQGAFNYLPLNFSTSTATPGSVVTTTDSFQSLSAVQPQAPYYGTFEGPGPLLQSDVSSRASSTVAALTDSSREIDLDLFGIRLGAFIQWRILGNLEAGVGGGLSLAPATGTFSYRDAAQDAGSGATLLELSGRENVSELLVGGYIEALVGYEFDRNWSIHAGFQYQYLEDLEAGRNGRAVGVTLGEAVYATVGVGYRF